MDEREKRKASEKGRKKVKESRRKIRRMKERNGKRIGERNREGRQRMPMATGCISLAYHIDFRMIKFYLLPTCWHSMEEVAFRFNLQ